jgi:UDP-N-acetylglucosamine 1-carboxyvinyltransferase
MVIILKRFIVKKPVYLKGTVRVSGSKNAALPIICASILHKDIVRLKNVPRISDVFSLLKILRHLCCKVKFYKNTLIIDSRKIKYKPLNIDECRRLRGSYYLIGPMLNLFGKCVITLPGGCNIGERPIDAHIDMLNALGYETNIDNNILYINRIEEKVSVNYKLIKRSVGASINAILTSLTYNKAIISNLVIEPEAMNLIDFLHELGYHIEATLDVCISCGRLYEPDEISFKIIPDRIEATTFIVMGLLCGDIKVKGSMPFHYNIALTNLMDAGYNVKLKGNVVRARKSKGQAFNIKTDYYPLFSTDMQPILAVLLSNSRGSCCIEETVFENRMQIFRDLNSCGGYINIIGNKAYVVGTDSLEKQSYKALDLRHSAALALLVLAFGGEVYGIDYMERGYERFFRKIRKLGAQFKLNRVKKSI